MSAQPHEELSRTERITMPIYGLACGGGSALTIERALQRVTGVQNAYVSPATEMAYVAYNSALCNADQLNEAVEHAGFHAGVPVLR